ncbi:M24 family metallopeptidase [Hephaestia mangrovi]|uniref:M24 family metallopeptidase n=1 Tax=Hephaestia mangrovi TaxID=2873268 RepID=UPI001CA69545|nr:Xaa-Pro peptidase family protein [Hephaestia mangrovi]MBY8827285.1 Xaa-Pro peptidase family protein [Hephaestia mangrovi]
MSDGIEIGRRGVLGAGALLSLASAAVVRAAEPDLAGLSDITTDARPIGAAEYAGRLARAQALMKAASIGAVVVEAGSSMVYFTGVHWWQSERLTAAILPVEGTPCIVTPFFEAPSVKETLAIPADIRVWQEDQNPMATIASFLEDRKLANRPIGIEANVRYFAFDGLAHALPDAKLVPATPVVRAVRMIKTPAELALMQKATDVTIAAYRWVQPRVEAGMSQDQVSALMDAATRKLGGAPEFSMVLIGESSAYPHGSKHPRTIADGEVVLMDCGCTVQGYQSDVSRTWVHGTATAEQRKVWSQVQQGQQVAIRAARVGTPAGEVDDAVRTFYRSLGYGPGYQLPGLSHRTGHGIGLDGHEPVYLVHGETTRLAPGMCFSDEPGIYIPGKFGVRLEDCFHMTADGPRFFSTPPRSIDQPV